MVLHFSSLFRVVVFSGAPQDRQLKIKDLVLSSHERAVRNCPWTMGLWKSYVQALERHGADHQTVSGKQPELLRFHFDWLLTSAVCVRNSQRGVIISTTGTWQYHLLWQFIVQKKMCHCDRHTRHWEREREFIPSLSVDFSFLFERWRLSSL